MKNIVVGFGLIIITILSIFILLAVNKNMTEKNILEKSTEAAAYQTLKECFDQQAIPIKSDEELIERFNDNLAIQLKPKNDVLVKLAAVDYKKGILSVEVSKTYQNMGIERMIKVRKTVIYEVKERGL